jgi:hypothetical protein
LICERGDFGPDQIDVGHCAWPGSAPTETLRFEHVWIEVPVEIIFCSFASPEDEENDQYDGEDGNGTPDDTTSNGGYVRARRRCASRASRVRREDELGGTDRLRLDLTILISGPEDYVEKWLAIVSDP